MNEEIDFSLVVRPHSAWSRLYIVMPDDGVVKFLTACSKDYPPEVGMDFHLPEGVKYEERTISKETYSKMLNCWQSISRSTVGEVMNVIPQAVMGGTIYSLKVEGRTMEMVFDWIQASTQSTPFDGLVEAIEECHPR